MSYTIKPGDALGRLGQGFGKGLSEQLPKEIERYRLASGLKQFEQESSGLNPVQQATRLASIYGMTPELMYTLSPLLRQQMKTDAGEKFGSGSDQKTKDIIGNKQNINPTAPQPKNKLSPTPQEAASNIKGIKSLESTKAQVTPIVKMSGEQKAVEASRISRETGLPYDDAKNIVEENEAANISNQQEQRVVGEAADILRNRVKNNLEKRWGKENVAKNIPSEIQSFLLDKMETDLADPNNNRSETDLEKLYGERGKNLGKATSNLEAKSKEHFPEWSPKKIGDSIKEAREIYKNEDSLELLADQISSLFNTTAPASSYLAIPPTKEPRKYFSNYKKLPHGPSISPYADELNKVIDKKSIQAADDLSKMDLSNDSLLSLAFEANKKGLNPQVLLDRLKDNSEKGLFKKSPIHSRDIQKGIPNFRSLGDVWLGTLLNDESFYD